MMSLSSLIWTIIKFLGIMYSFINSKKYSSHFNKYRTPKISLYIIFEQGLENKETLIFPYYI